MIPIEQQGGKEVVTKMNDKPEMFRLEDGAKVGVGYGSLYCMEDRVNLVNTNRMGVIRGIKCLGNKPARYWIEWDDGNTHWVDEDLLEREKDDGGLLIIRQKGNK